MPGAMRLQRFLTDGYPMGCLGTPARPYNKLRMNVKIPAAKA